MANRLAILHCALISGIGDVTIGRICAVLGPDRCAEIYGWTSGDFIERAGISFSQAQLLTQGLADRGMIEREFALIQKHAISFTTIIDDDYPAALKTIYAPPAVLFWRGVAPNLFPHIMACIGSRAANRYARSVINHFVPEFVAAGWCIASGGALGADTMAHEAALEAGGKTIAIIGSGLLKPYPATNKKLFERIQATGGSVLSPFPLDMQAMPGNFPARNRIISGLSSAVVVVQAAEKSGARITALQALEQGREVCVVPGDIFDPLSAGCHRLLSEGATPVTSAADVLQACGCVPVTKTAADLSSNGQISLIEPKARMSTCDPLLDLCREARTFDELLVAAECDFAWLQERLFDLQLEGVVTQDFLGRWTAV
jgi:DNA processing protein